MKLVKNSIWYTVSGFAPQIVSILMLPIYTRFLTPHDYGIISLAITFIGILDILMGLQLHAGISRLYFDYDEYEKKEYFSTIIFSIIILSLTVGAIINFFGENIISSIFSSSNLTYKPYFLIALISVFFNQIRTTCFALLHVEQKGNNVLTLSLFNLLFLTIIKIKFVIFDELGAFGVLYATLLSSIVFALSSLFITRKSIRLVFNKNMISDSIKFSIPIIFHAAGGFLFVASDRIILEKYVTLSMIGIYDIADRISMVLKLIVNSINTALNPNFIEQSKISESRTRKNYKNYINIWSIIICLIYTAISLFSEEILVLLTPKEYHSAALLIPVLSAAYIFRGLYQFSVNTIFYKKKTHLIPIITISAGVINVILTIIFAMEYGIIGAAWATLIAHLATFIIAFLISNKIHPLEWNWKAIIEIFCIGQALLIVISYISFTNYFMAVITKISSLVFLAIYLGSRKYNNKALAEHIPEILQWINTKKS